MLGAAVQGCTARPLQAMQACSTLHIPSPSFSGSHQETPSQPQQESINDSEPIQIDDDEPQLEDVDFATKRKLTSVVWKDFKKVKVSDDVKAQCLHCHKQLGGKSINGTKHLHDHLKICTLRRIKLMGQNKTLAQSSLRLNSQEGGKIFMDAYKEEQKKAIAYMYGTKSRVAITTDLWTSDNQKRWYMAITAHFIDDSWTLRNIIRRFIYVPAPHTSKVFCEELYEALVG